MKRKVPLRASPELWTFKVITNDSKTRIESAGPVNPDLGKCLRVLQLHISRLSIHEQIALIELTNRVIARMEMSS